MISFKIIWHRRVVYATLGFTLLEIMAALAIMAVVLISVYKLHTQTIAMNYDVKFHTTAPLLAQSKAGEIGIKPLDELTYDSGDFGEEFPGYGWQRVIEDVESEALGSTAEDLKRIDIIVSYNTDEFTYSLRTYRFLRN